MPSLENPKAYKLVADLNKIQGVKAIKTHADQYTGPGVPDIIGSWRGRAFAIEMKKDEKTDPEPIQLYELQKWAESGAITLVAWEPREAIEYLHEMSQVRPSR